MSAFLPIIAAAFFGLGYAFSEKALSVVNVATYLMIGGIMSIFIALGLSHFKAEPLSWDFFADKQKMIMVFVAVLSPALGWIFTVYAIKNISATYAAFAELSYPLFTLLFLFIFFGVKDHHWSIFVGGTFMLVGSFILVYGQNIKQ